MMKAQDLLKYFLVVLYGFQADLSPDDFCTDLKDIPNPDWFDLAANLTIGADSFGPAVGSTMLVNRTMVCRGPYGDREMTKDIALHTPTNSHIRRPRFHDITRWYQEDGNTQIFRMFPGEDNVRNQRRNAPRVEAYGLAKWKRGDGWHEWSGRYTFLEARRGAVLQIKHNSKFWSMQLNLEEIEDGTINLSYQKLRDPDSWTVLERDVLMKSFDVRVLDDGTRHRVYVNDELRVEGEFHDRANDESNQYRWGLYSPREAMDRDILILVTGVYVGEARELDF